jgi:hypothetical protein
MDKSITSVLQPSPEEILFSVPSPTTIWKVILTAPTDPRNNPTKKYLQNK